MNIRITFSFIMVCVILLITACGRNRTSDTLPMPDPYAPPSPVTDPYIHGDTTLRGNLHPVRDMNAQTLTIASLTHNAIPFMATTAHNFEPDPAASDNYLRDRRIWNNARRVERAFNITVDEFIPRGTTSIQHLLSTSSMAGGSFADVVFAAPELTMTAATNGWILPLDEIELPRSDLLGAQMYSRFVAEGLGHAWAFNTSEPDSSAFTLLVNLDIIDAIGAPCPVELYHNGEWTWEAWLEIIRLATRDTTGDGVIDQWGAFFHPADLFYNLVGANDGVIITDDFSFGLDHPATIEAAEFIGTILQEGHLRPHRGWRQTGYGRNGRPAFTDYGYRFGMNDSAVAFMTDPTWLRIPSIFGYWTRCFQGATPNFNFAIVPLPIGPSNSSGNTGLGGWRDGIVLPHGSTFTPADRLMIFEEYFSWPIGDLELLHAAPITWGDGTILDSESAIRHLSAIQNKRFDAGFYIADIAMLSSGLVFNFVLDARLPDNPRPIWDVIEDLRDPVQDALHEFSR